jgi:hypothetical protein
MGNAHQEMEHAEHIAHSGGDHGGSDHGSKNKRIGVTMACIGALIAFCAAMVGSERNELTRTMMEQTQAHSDYAGASVKFRAIMIELEKQRGKLVVIAENNVKVSSTMDMAVVKRFLKLSTDYAEERELSKKWSESYKPLVDAHFEAAESYERAQLIAELGIVVASLAVLLGNRSAWIVSIVLSACCLVQLMLTAAHTRKTVDRGLVLVEHAEGEYHEMRERHVGANEDARTLEAVDPGGKIRNSDHPTQAAHESAKPANPESASAK